MQRLNVSLVDEMILLEDAQYVEEHDKQDGGGAQKIEIRAFLICVLAV